MTAPRMRSWQPNVTVAARERQPGQAGVADAALASRRRRHRRGEVGSADVLKGTRLTGGTHGTSASSRRPDGAGMTAITTVDRYRRPPRT